MGINIEKMIERKRERRRGRERTGHTYKLFLLK
jgi:hypothetical protein